MERGPKKLKLDELSFSSVSFKSPRCLALMLVLLLATSGSKYDTYTYSIQIGRDSPLHFLVMRGEFLILNHARHCLPACTLKLMRI